MVFATSYRKRNAGLPKKKKKNLNDHARHFRRYGVPNTNDKADQRSIQCHVAHKIHLSGNAKNAIYHILLVQFRWQFSICLERTTTCAHNVCKVILLFQFRIEILVSISMPTKRRNNCRKKKKRNAFGDDIRSETHENMKFSFSSFAILF